MPCICNNNFADIIRNFAEIKLFCVILEYVMQSKHSRNIFTIVGVIS